MSESPAVWDPKNAYQSLRYAITWHVRRTGCLPTQVIIPEATQVEGTTARALASEVKALGVTIDVDGAALGVVCQGQGRAVQLHQLPWRPLY